MRPYENVSETRRAVDDVDLPSHFPAKRSGRELKFPAVLPESPRKALIIQGSVLDIEKISRYFPVGREIRGRPRHGSGRVWRSLQPQPRGDQPVRSGLMKIASIQTGIVALPNDEPLA